MRRYLFLIYLFIPVLFCSALDIVSDLPGKDWIETQSEDPLIKKAYIVKPDRNDISVMIMSEEMPADSMLDIPDIMDNYKIGLMNNDLFKDGDYKQTLNMKIGGNTWGKLEFRKEFDQFYIFHDSYITIKGNTVIYITFFTLNEADYNKYAADVKSFLEKLKLQ